jgi:hypothetical protein
MNGQAAARAHVHCRSRLDVDLTCQRERSCGLRGAMFALRVPGASGKGHRPQPTESPYGARALAGTRTYRDGRVALTRVTALGGLRRRRGAGFPLSPPTGPHAARAAIGHECVRRGGAWAAWRGRRRVVVYTHRSDKPGRAPAAAPVGADADVPHVEPPGTRSGEFGGDAGSRVPVARFSVCRRAGRPRCYHAVQTRQCRVKAHIQPNRRGFHTDNHTCRQRESGRGGAQDSTDTDPHSECSSPGAGITDPAGRP